MKIVAETLHLQKRGNIWHYYRRTPLHLVPIIGRRFFKKSLKTSCLAEAKKLRTIEDLKCDAQFAAAEDSAPLGTGADGTPTSVSFEVLIEYVRQTVERRDKRSCTEFATDPPQGGEEWRDCLIDTRAEQSILTNPGDPRQDEFVSGVCERILSERGATIDDQDLRTQFAEIVRRGLLELVRRRTDRLEDRYERPFYDTLFDPARLPTVAFEQLAPLDQAIEFAAKQSKPTLSPVTQKVYLQTFRAGVHF